MAMTVLSVGIMGTLQLFHVGIQKIQASEESRIALRAIENELETLHTMPSSLRSGPEERPFISVTPELERLHAVRSVVQTAPGPEESLTEVVMSVDWIGEKGRRMHRQIHALIPESPKR